MIWQLDGNQSRLQCGRITAQIDLEYPARGVGQIKYRGTSLTGTHILRVISAEGDRDQQELPSHHHVRGTDLIASYGEQGGCPVAREVYWRVVCEHDTNLCGLELWLSAETRLLDSDPHLVCASNLPACAIYHLPPEDTGEFAKIETRPGERVVLTRGESAGVVLFRPAAQTWSYCQMVHPADFDRSTIDDRQNRQTEITTSFFAQERLEKGVIRRARVRGLFVPRGDDFAQTVDAYRHFAASQLPLTT
jgi:hypothetical protein